MQTEKHQATCRLLYKFSQLFNQKITDEKIETYADFLQEFETKELTLAFSSFIKKGGQFFPSLPELMSELNPAQKNEDAAQLMANRIWDTSVSKGRHDLGGIKKHLSEIEYLALESFGITTILDSTLNQVPTLKAHLRRTCEAMLNQEQVRKRREQISIVKNKENLVDFDGAIKQLNFRRPQ